jgi:hypothetical protein
MCKKVDADVVIRANRKTRKNVHARVAAISMDEIVVTTTYRGVDCTKTISKTIPTKQLSEAFGKSYAKIVRGGTEI